MAEHKLAILVSAVGTAKAAKNLKGLDATISNIGAHAGRGLRTAGHNIARMGVAALAAGAAITVMSVKSGLESLVEREDVISATAGAIKATGNAAGVSAEQIRGWSEAIESATGAAVDDKAIQAGANTLLRFGAVAEDQFKRALEAAVDLGAGMKTGPEQGARILGKALADPVKGMTALRRAGIVLTATEEKRIKQLVKANKLTDAQAVLLTAIESRYKGAAAASQGPYSRALATMADATEDAQMALAEGFLPVIERAATWLRTKLADPATIQSLRDFGHSLAGAFDEAMNFLEGVDWKSIGDGLRVAADWAGRLFGAFMSMPSEVKGTIIALAGLNTLSGGAISGIAGELGKGLIKGVLGINAGVVNVRGAVVNGGGLPGGKGGGVPGIPAAGAGGGALAAIGGMAGFTAVAGAAAIALYYGVPALANSKPANGQGDAEPIRTKGGGTITGANAGMVRLFTPGLKTLGQEATAAAGKLDRFGRVVPNAVPQKGTVANDPTGFLNSGPMQSLTKASWDTHSEQIATTRAVDAVAGKQAESLIAFRAGERTSATGLANTASASRLAGVVGAVATGASAGRIVGAIAANRPIVTTTVNVHVTAAQVSKSVTVQGRAGRGNGSAGGGTHPGGGGP